MASCNVFVAMGSPRKDGNSAALAGQVAAGAEAAGAHVTSAYLHGLGISPCSACAACQGSTSDECIVEDAMQQLFPKVREADALVIATPIYWFSVSAQTKAFLDRCYALGGPQGSALKGKRIGIVATYEDADAFVSGAVNAFRSLQDMFAYVGAPIEGIVHGTAAKAGEIRANAELMARAFELGKRLGRPR